jgi:NADP-dependent aldehyde dehydrogenase
MITGKNYIGNQLSANGSKTFTTFNPIENKENNWQITEASSSEVDEAAKLAGIAFKEYSQFSGKKKAAFLNAIANEIESLGDALLETYCSESGLPQGRANGERGRTLGQLRAFANHLEDGNWVEATIDTAQPDRQPAPKVDLRKMNVALGPVAVFGASNFPLAFSTAGGDAAAALAAGCPVVVKSHPMHAGTGEMVASAVVKAAKKTGMPNGVFSNLNSSGNEVGQQLVQHSNIKAVGFTGSLKGGRALYNLAVTRKEPIPVFAEMGSVNPVILLPKSLENRGEDLAKTYAGSITLGSGQFCTNPGLIVGIKSNGLTNFTKHLASAIKEVEPSCMLHPNIANAYNANKETALQQNGVSVLANISTPTKSNFAAQAVITASGKEFIANPTLHQEVFGPFSLVIQCKNKTELEQVINNLEGQLTGTVISDDNELEDYKTVVSELQNKVGRIIFNGVPTGVEVCPSMLHGGPYPASTDSRFTAVGVDSIKRFVRPFSFQDWPNNLLPEELKNENSLAILRTVNGLKTTNSI